MPTEPLGQIILAFFSWVLIAAEIIDPVMLNFPHLMNSEISVVQPLKYLLLIEID
jgi:hypothetical protein